MVGGGVAPLGLLGAEEFKKATGGFGIAADARHPTPRDVHVHGIGPTHRHLLPQVLIGFALVSRLHAAEVIAVGQGNTALPLRHGANHRCVAAEHRLGQVGDHPLDPVHGSGLSNLIQHESHEGLVVDAAAVAQAELPLHGGRCQGGVAAHLIGLNQISIEHRGPQATGQAEPAVLTIAEILGDALVQAGRIHGLEQIHVGRPIQTGRVGQDQHVRRCVVALRVQAFDQGVILGLQQLHLDPGLFGKALVERLVGVVVAPGINADLRRLVLAAGTQHHGAGQSECSANTSQNHVVIENERHSLLKRFANDTEERCPASRAARPRHKPQKNPPPVARDARQSAVPAVRLRVSAVGHEQEWGSELAAGGRHHCCRHRNPATAAGAGSPPAGARRG